MGLLALLLSLLLAALGVTAAAFALNDYFGPQLSARRSQIAAVGTPETLGRPQLVMRSRTRFVLLDQEAVAAPAKPKAAKALAKRPAPTKDKQPEKRAAEVFPWNLFKN
jgi:hypothetical protein